MIILDFTVSTLNEWFQLQYVCKFFRQYITTKISHENINVHLNLSNKDAFKRCITRVKLVENMPRLKQIILEDEDNFYWLQNLKELKQLELISHQYSLFSIFARLDSIETLIVTTCTIESDLFYYLQFLPTLRTLHLNNCTLRSNDMSEIEQLTSLTLNNIMPLDLQLQLPSSLEYLYCEGIEFIPNLVHMFNLKILKLIDSRVTNFTLRIIGTTCKNLETLDLSGCGHYSLDGLDYIKQLPMLKNVNLYRHD